ncbi:MAG: prepilin-type N-terminal cleavage/methylation domain-containing protein [Thermodesulfobacteriota bacterium]
MKTRTRERGFTLIELLIAMAITGIVMGAVYSTYYSQQKSYVAQEQIAEAQQNLRAALYYLEREIRMAGYDPTGQANAGLVTTNANTIRFTMDLTNNAGTGGPDGDTGDTNEDVTYSLYTSGGVQMLGRKSPSTAANVPVASNIDALDFVYLDDNGAVTANLANMRAVQITVVARTSRRDPGYQDTTVYRNQQGTAIYTAAGDAYRRRVLSAQVRCRNLGLL